MRLAVLAGALEVAGVDRCRGQLAGLAEVCDAAPGPPHARRSRPCDTASASCVAHPSRTRRAASVRFCERSVSKLQLAGLDLGAVLLALEVAHLRASGLSAARSRRWRTWAVEGMLTKPHSRGSRVRRRAAKPSGPTPWARMRKDSLLPRRWHRQRSQMSRVSNSSRSGVAP